MKQQPWREIRFHVDDFWECFQQSYWLNIGSTLLVLVLWGWAVHHVAAPQTIHLSPESVWQVRQGIGYWLILVGVWMFNHGWYVLIFVFRNGAVRLKYYWGFLLSGLLLLFGLYALHALLGALSTLVPLLNDQYRDFLRGVSHHTRSERGGAILSSYQAERFYRKRRPRRDPGILWGGVRLPTSQAVLNFMTIGSVGSGKTLTLRLLLQSLLHLEETPDDSTFSHRNDR